MILLPPVLPILLLILIYCVAFNATQVISADAAVGVGDEREGLLRSKRWPAPRRRDRNREVDVNGIVTQRGGAGEVFPAIPGGLNLPRHSVDELTMSDPIHTFGTADACERNCPVPCLAQELEDLAMMQRWICPTKSSSNHIRPPTRAYSAVDDPNHQSMVDMSRGRGSAPTSTSFREVQGGGSSGRGDGGGGFLQSLPFSSQFLLFIVPLAMLFAVLLVIVIPRCCRCSKSSPASSPNTFI